MIRLISPIVVICLLMIGACSTDFELAAEWKDIPVVYGLVSITDTAHYIRVERAFLDPDGDAREIAQIPDSIYYDDDIAVQFENVETGETFNLTRVDGNLDGYPRDEGTFASSPNYLYKVLAEEVGLEGGEQLRLIINRGDDLDIVTAETTILNPITISQSPPEVLTIWDYSRIIRINWRSSEDAELFDIRMIIYYLESDPDNPDLFIDKSVEWVIDSEFERDSDSELLDTEVAAEQFYRFLASALEVTNVTRRFKEMEVVVTGGGQELRDFLDFSRANIGITSAQSLPEFPNNLSEGQGIFTSRTSGSRGGIQLSDRSIDTLANGFITKDLNFQN